MFPRLEDVWVLALLEAVFIFDFDAQLKDNQSNLLALGFPPVSYSRQNAVHQLFNGPALQAHIVIHPGLHCLLLTGCRTAGQPRNHGLPEAFSSVNVGTIWSGMEWSTNEIQHVFKNIYIKNHISNKRH